MQYRQLLRKIKYEGEDVMPQQEEGARMFVGPQLRFRFANGFPVITERDLSRPIKEGGKSIFEQSIAELVAFLNGARTQEQLVAFGCPWWKRWLTPEKCTKRGLVPGDNGPGSYGAAWRTFPTSEGEPFDQITHLNEQMAQLPHLRTHFLTPWVPQYVGRGTKADGTKKVQKVVVAPCHGWVHVLLNPDQGTLTLHHSQRSGDVPVGVAGNIIQYAALALMWAQVLGYRAKELVYTISDAHVYDKQWWDVDDLLATAAQPFPTVTVDPSVNNIFEFRPEHFKMMDYQPQLPPRYIWTPV
ncbi:MAG: thymidylate synthase [Candidatus Yanofskybacteria bacterium]|nr:thymidylate synthase [Candidatus Yanofskybacteria bacterium]